MDPYYDVGTVAEADHLDLSNVGDHCHGAGYSAVFSRLDRIEKIGSNLLVRFSPG